MFNEIAIQIILENALKSVAKYLKEKHLKLITSSRDLEEAISIHLKQVANWSQEIVFKDLSKQKLTSSVFVDLDISLMPMKNRQDLEVPQTISSKNIFERTNKHLAILGQPGAGKTTLMKFICQSIFSDKEFYGDKFKIPILIRLRDLNLKLVEKADNHPISNYIFELLGLTIESKNTETKKEEIQLAKQRILIPILEELRCLVILDGYDEITEDKHKDQIFYDYKELTLNLNSSVLILTSRSSDFNFSLENVKVLEICPLTTLQVEKFAELWLVDPPKVSKFLTGLKESPYYDTAIRPLTVGHLCAIFERSGKIPDKPKTVYRKIVNLLLEEWDEQRGIKRLSNYGAFELDRKFEFLSRLAYELTIEYEINTFTDSHLKSIYNNIYSDFDLRKNEVNQVINELESHTGLILEVGYHKFEFAHKSIQEYLCAEHLVKLPRIPETKILQYLPNELAIAVTISSNPSLYFIELVLNHFSLKKINESFITIFVNRLVIEKPDFNTSPHLSFALIVLYTLFRKSETTQLNLFEYDLPAQFSKFVELIFERNKRISIKKYYELDTRGYMNDLDILQLRKIPTESHYGRYPLPEYIYIKKAFVSDYDEELI